jgi:hypothetical protein
LLGLRLHSCALTRLVDAVAHKIKIVRRVYIERA